MALASACARAWAWALAFAWALASVLGFTWSQLATRRELLEASTTRRTLALVIDWLEQDLLTAVASTSDGGAGIIGDEHSVTVLARGVTPRWSDDPSETLGDLHLLNLSYDSGEGIITMTRDGDPRSSDQQSATLPELPGRLRDLVIRYHDGNQWRSSWDSRDNGGLPRAVEISAWYGVPSVTEARDEMATPNDDSIAEPAEAPREDTERVSIPNRRRIIQLLDPQQGDAGENDGEGER